MGLVAIAQHVAAIQEELRENSRAWGTPPLLVAVTKTQPPERINALPQAGVRDIGENRVQEWLTKAPELDPSLQLHVIGQLQTNKVKYIIEHACLIHSLDRPALAEEIDRQGRAHGRCVPVLVEVNIGGERTKAGFSPGEVMPFLTALGQREGLVIRGLMTVLPPVDDPEALRPLCRAMRQLFERLQKTTLPGVTMQHLSMGMSQDYRIAAQEGATIVRIGSAIFGKRA